MFALPLFKKAVDKLIKEKKDRALREIAVVGSSQSGKSLLIQGLLDDESN